MKKVNICPAPASAPAGRKTNSKALNKEKALIKIKHRNLCVFTIVLAIVAMGIFVAFLVYAIISDKPSDYLGFWSDVLRNLIYSILGDVIVSFLAVFVFREHVGWFMGIGIAVIIIVFSFSGILMIGSLNLKSEFTADENGDKEDANMQSDIEIGYYKLPYIFDNDPFFEIKEEYFGVKKGTLSNEQIIQYMADTIEEDMKAQKLIDSDISEAYTQYVQAADLEYQTYLYQRERDWNMKESYLGTYLKEERIGDLNSAKEQRIEGDKEHKDAENQRIIAIYCKDIGDEYVKDDNQQDAANAFEESAEWAMKSIYIAYFNGDYAKMKEALKCLDNAFEALDGLEDIGGEKKNNLSQCCDAYRLIVDKYSK